MTVEKLSAGNDALMTDLPTLRRPSLFPLSNLKILPGDKTTRRHMVRAQFAAGRL
jgi:hypothetical protein